MRRHWIDDDCPKCKEEEQKAEGADQSQETMHVGSMNLYKRNEAGHDSKWPIHVWVDGNPDALEMKQVLVCYDG
jgi:hypothetical protein